MGLVKFFYNHRDNIGSATKIVITILLTIIILIVMNFASAINVVFSDTNSEMIIFGIFYLFAYIGLVIAVAAFLGLLLSFLLQNIFEYLAEFFSHRQKH